MIPKAGKFDKGSLIKLYYINQEIIDASNQEVTIPNLIGLTIPEAREHLQEVGFKPAMEILTADAKYAKQKINVVIDMEPKANLFTTTAVKGSLIKLKYRKRPITKYIEKGSKVLSTLEPFSIYKLS